MVEHTQREPSLASMPVWKLREAKAELSKVVRLAAAGQPQQVTVAEHGHSCRDPLRHRTSGNAALREDLILWLDRTLRPWFAGRILALNEEVTLEWRRMVESGRKRGVVFSHPDVFIAATARVHGLVVCTRDERGFQGADISVVNP